MIVQHNLPSMNATRQLKISGGALEKNTEKLSSGYRINRAGDDAAGLSISEKMRAQIRGLDRASTNSQDGISLIQTAEGALNETHSILQRMRELAVQAASDTNTDEDRTRIQEEIDSLTDEVDRIATSTEFNTKKLLNGNLSGIVSRDIAGSAKGNGTGSLNVTFNLKNGTNAASGANATGVVRLVWYSGVTAAGTADSTQGCWKISGAQGTVNLTQGQTTTAADISSNKTEIIFNNVKFTISGTLNHGDAIVLSTSKKINAGGNSSGSLKIQAGANAGQEISFSISDMRASGLSIRAANGRALSVSSGQGSASTAIEMFDMAIQKVSRERSKLGAIQNRLEHTIANLDTASENLSAAESRIRDTDMAKEMTQYSKNNILQQAGQSMLAQANQQTQGVLTLLR